MYRTSLIMGTIIQNTHRSSASVLVALSLDWKLLGLLDYPNHKSSRAVSSVLLYHFYFARLRQPSSSNASLRAVIAPSMSL